MLDDVIGSWTAARSLAEVMAVMVDTSVPAGPVYAAQDMLADPHFRERGGVLDADVVVDRDVERVTFPGVVPKLDQMPGEVRWLGPPSCGQGRRRCSPSCSGSPTPRAVREPAQARGGVSMADPGIRHDHRRRVAG